MDDDVRAAFDEILGEMRRGYAQIGQRLDRVDGRLDSVEQRLDRVEQRLDAMDQRLDGVGQRLARIDQRFDEVELRFSSAGQMLDQMDRRFADIDQRFASVALEIRDNGVLTEDLRVQIQHVAEVEGENARAIERLRAEMNERFRENEIVLAGAFRRIRQDIDDLRERR